MIIKDFNETEFEELLKDEKVLVDFYATWCGPCKMLSPEIEELSKEMSNLKVIKVDVDKYQKLSTNYKIMSVPTLILYNNGNLIGSKSGYMPKTVLKEWIEESIK